MKRSTVDKASGKEVIRSSEPPIAQEITYIIKEWCPLWKQLFILRDKNFDIIKSVVYELIDLRSKILSGTLPTDEIKELRQKATLLIDSGNYILKLDLSVRDELGNFINSAETCAIDLYNLHENAQKKNKESVKSILPGSSKKKTLTNFSVFSHNLCVIVKNFACHVTEDVQLLMSLYDAKESKFISENFFVEWNQKKILRDLDLLNNLKVLFCDLGSKDLEREKMYFICQIVRIGNMENKDLEPQKQRHNTIYNSQKKLVDGLRRPFGVAALEISDILNGKRESDIDNEIFVPILQFTSEKDSLDSLIKKITNSKTGDINPKDHKGQGLWISLKMLHGELKQVREEYPHLVSPLTAIAKKMGFPEVILPEDIRNDLYLTLVGGDFSSRSTNAKNIEISVQICNENGDVLDSVITYGAGSEMISDYKSVIYYHEEKPRWMETFKISIPVEHFYNLHLKFTFRHRSSVESKDKEKPFAYAYIKLMNENGTTIKDKQHNLIIYKVDTKKFESNLDGAFKHLLSKPSTKGETEKLTNSNKNLLLINGNSTSGLTINLKDSFLIETIICSTKLTQNIDLLGLLKWSSRSGTSNEELKDCLNALMKVDGEEIVKFLQDTLDSLFNILMEKDTEEFNYLVFEALVFIIGLISNPKYQHFRPVLDVYIQENFSATLAYNKLIFVLINFIDSLTEGRILIDSVSESFNLRAMKCLEFIFKFIVRSRFLFASLNGGRNQPEFEESMTSLLNSISRLLSTESNASIIVQGSCLKYLPFAIPDILTVFNSKKLSLILITIINSVPIEKLRTQKMVCILDILRSQSLFNDTECRMIFLPVFNNHIKLLMKSGDFSAIEKTFSVSSDGESRKQHEEELNICIQVLSNMLSCLYKQAKNTVFDDINNLINTLLPTLIQTIIETERSDRRIGGLVAILIEIFRQMTSIHFDHFISNLLDKQSSDNALLIFLTKMLRVFKDLVVHPIYTSEWTEMIMVQNTVILNTLSLISEKMMKIFVWSSFDKEIYNNFFHCAIAFLTQKSLQLENFSANKRNRLLSKYKDMRKETAVLIRYLWFFLKDKKSHFIPSMVGPILEMSLIPEIEIRKIGLRIYFDMMEFEHSQLAAQRDGGAGGEQVFSVCEQELITQLDKKLESGKGDDDFKGLFLNEISFFFQSSTIREQGLKFGKTAYRLMKHLLEYRNVINCSSTSENNDQISLCLMRIIEFCHAQKQQEMYLRYLYKLCDLHLRCDNFSEAAFVLKLHTILLDWSGETLDPALKSERYPYLDKHRELKERLYQDAIEYFDKGKLYEEGLRMCKELAAEYENETYDFNQLSELHRQMAIFYDNIMKQIRPKSEYYRVSYYGKAFCNLLQNKTFIYRAKPYEKLFEFRANLLSQFPNATLLESLLTPGPETTEANMQAILINQVEPVMSDRIKEKFAGRQVNHQIQQYYEANEVQTFCYSRKKKVQSDSSLEENEFANMWLERTYLTTSYPLPGILTWFPVLTTSSYSLSPIENAIETMEKTNANLKKTILQNMNDPSQQISQLTMMLNGIIEPAVNGGTSKYEEVFFTDDYRARHSTSKEEAKIAKLKTLIAEQIPLLEVGIQVHRERADASMQPLHNRLEDLFVKMKESVQKKYGEATVPKELAQWNLIKMRNQAIKNRQLSRYSGTESISQQMLGKFGQISSQTHSSFDLAKHGSMLSLTNTVKKTKSAFVRSNGQAFPSTNSLGLHSLINTGTSTLTKFRPRHKENSITSLANGSAQSNGQSSSTMTRKANQSQSQFYVPSEPAGDEQKEQQAPATASSKAKSTNDLRNGNNQIVLREKLEPLRPLKSNYYENKRSSSRPSSGSNYLQVYRNSISHGNSSTSLSPQCSEPDSKSEESTASNSLTNILNENSSLTGSTLNSNLNSSNPMNNSSLVNSSLVKSPPSLPAPFEIQQQQSLDEPDRNKDDDEPPPLPMKHHSTILESAKESSKFLLDSTSTSPMKHRNSCSSVTLKKKLPPLPNSSSSGSLQIGLTKSPVKSNGYHLSVEHESANNYEHIPPLRKKPFFRPVPPLPSESKLGEDPKPKESPNGTTNSGETEV